MISIESLPKTNSGCKNLGRALSLEATAVALAILLALSPFLLRHATWLWMRPHYQFFPLVIIGAVVLAAQRLRGVQIRPDVNLRSILIALFGVWGLLAAAIVLQSSWLACLAGMGAVPVSAYAIGGRDLVRRILPAWGLLWLLVPPPLDLDRLLIVKLQGLTAAWSSSVLDVLGVLHTQTGNVIEIDGRRLFVEEACSGVNSLYSVLSCTLFFVLFTRRGWFRGAVLMLAAVAWVLAANVARVVAVAWIETNWGITVGSGWRHELLGIAMFAIAIGMLLSTDRLLTFLTRVDSVQPEPVPPTAPPEVGSCIAFPRKAAIAIICAFAGLFVAYWMVTPGNSSVVASPPLLSENPELLPPTLGRWQRGQYAVHTRDVGSYFGEQSHTWVFANQGLQALVSLDSPFPEWHDLTWCYVSTGWEMQEQSVRDHADVPGGFVEVSLTRPTHRFSHLCFCEFDVNGNPVSARPGGSAASHFRHKLAMSQLWPGNEAHTNPVPPIYQLQVFVEGWAPLSTAEEELVRELFVNAQAAIRSKTKLGH
jgi:exosortase